MFFFTKVVAETMNNYLMFDKILKVKFSDFHQFFCILSSQFGTARYRVSTLYSLVTVSVSDPDPDSNCQTGSGSVFGIRIRKVKLSYKNPLFPQIFNDFQLF